MSRVLVGEGLHRTHVENPLMRESLVDSAVLAATESDKIWAMLPDVAVVGLGGRSILDRGASAILPMRDEIVRNHKDGRKLILGVGTGVRGRHTLTIGLDLGIPVGGLAACVGAVEEQNLRMLLAVLAPYGGMHLIRDFLGQLPMYVETGMIPISIGIPPYRFWEPPPEQGHLPINGPDVGLYHLAETIGARQMIFCKDVDGIYTDDPAKNPDAKPLPHRISVAELLALDLPDLPIERAALELLQNARLVREFQIIDGLVAGNLTRALAGEKIGTTVHQ
ncbi:MAG: uridine kinase [Candidatus Sericytochromatia bacterium]|uniref:Uridine kinase n=1 Tax=Candidatus Tanganyikabacteria bacterium TaxID=2961651 RepID=A0A938BM73_9BACT|nr:uridine kinase [Candidatus Tanganyikabacteria bacterium]